jgi:hypothetical protein
VPDYQEVLVFRRLALTGALTLALLGASVPATAASTQRLDAPASTQRLDAPASAERLDAPASAERLDAPASAERLGAPASATATNVLSVPASTTASERLDAPASTMATDVLSVRGAGPFRIGVTQRSLADAGLLTGVVTQPGCPIVRAGATGEWSGKILLAFRNGRLAEVGTATAPPRSPAGAQVGMSWADLESVYGRRGHLIHNAAGEPAYVVHVGARVELFTGHPIREGAGYFQVGRADFILRNFRHAPPC